VQPVGPQVIIGRMRIACGIPKATEIQSKDLIRYLLRFHCNNGYINPHQCYVRRTSPILLLVVKKLVVFALVHSVVKGKAVPLQAWSGPEDSRKLRFPDYMTIAQDGGKVVSLTHRPPLHPENAPGIHFC
jgi:hypothetical protein